MRLQETIRPLAAAIVGPAIRLFARAVTAVRPFWQGIDPGDSRVRVYFANHVSNGDFVLIWTVLPPRLREGVRPVAAADYWNKTAIRRFVGRHVFRALLIERGEGARTTDPVGQMAQCLEQGQSLIIFPEGMRNLTEETLLPFKSGIYRLGRAVPEADLVPVWIENLNRVLPKGTLVPVPLMCSVTFGAAMRIGAEETSEAFLDRARTALLDLRPRREAA